jgi:hypothetical protein
MWLIVCRPNLERKSAALLEREGSVCFIPMCRRWTKAHQKRRPVLVERPVFVSYYFVCEPAPRRIEHCRLLTVAGEYISAKST